MQHRDTQAVDVWLTSSQKSLSWLSCIPEFPVLLVRRLHRTRKYLDPVSISLKTSIIQTGLIRSALIAISNDGNNMKPCVCHPHPSLSFLVVLKCCVQFCPAPRLSCLEFVSEWVLWRWWRADVAGALRMIWGQTLDWAWRAFKERQAFDITHQASATICGFIQSNQHLYTPSQTHTLARKEWHPVEKSTRSTTSTPQRPGTRLVIQCSTTGLHLCYVCMWTGGGNVFWLCWCMSFFAPWVYLRACMHFHVCLLWSVDCLVNFHSAHSLGLSLRHNLILWNK